MAKKKTTLRKAKSTPASKRKVSAKKAASKKPASPKAAKKVAKASTAKKKAVTKKKAAPKKKSAAKKKVTPKKKSVAKKKTTRKETASKSKPASRASAKTVKKVAKRATGAARKPVSESKAASPPIEVEPSLPKTRLNAKQLASFKELLLEKRRELLGDVRTLTKDALGRSRQDSTGDLSSMPIHMADIGSDNWEQDFTLGLIANEQQLVREIDEALRRIEDRTYGVCTVTHKPISIARLRAKPWAKYCIDYARQRETGRY